MGSSSSLLSCRAVGRLLRGGDASRWCWSPLRASGLLLSCLPVRLLPPPPPPPPPRLLGGEESLRPLSLSPGRWRRGGGASFALSPLLLLPLFLRAPSLPSPPFPRPSPALALLLGGEASPPPFPERGGPGRWSREGDASAASPASLRPFRRGGEAPPSSSELSCRRLLLLGGDASPPPPALPPWSPFLGFRRGGEASLSSSELSCRRLLLGGEMSSPLPPAPLTLVVVAAPTVVHEPV